MQHAEEADTESEPQRLGAFRLVLQCRVVEREFLQGFAEVLEIVGADREQAGIYLRLDALEAGQHLHVRRAGERQGIAHRRTMDILDPGDDEAHFAGLEIGGGGVLGREHTNAVHLMHLAGGLHQHLVALLDATVAYPHQRHHTQVVVEPGVDDHACSGASISPVGGGITATRRSSTSSTPIPLLALQATASVASMPMICSISSLTRFGFCLRQVHLVEHRHDLEALLDGGVAVGNRLCLYP